MTVQQCTSASDGAGGLSTTWTTLTTCWASVEPLSGRELLRAQSVQSDVSVRVRMRYNSQITTSHRLSHSGKVYEIVGVIDLESRHETIELLCKGIS